MGFSGGGSNTLKPHKHSSAAQDGSPLNMVNVTEGSLNAGDIVYSDGNALQRLAIGNPAQLIQVNAGATAPEYVTPSVGPTTAQTIISAGGHRTTTSTTLVDVTGMSLTLPNTGGTLDCLCNQMLSAGISDAGDSLRFALVQNVTALVYTTEDAAPAGEYNTVALSCLCDGNADTLKLQWSTAGGATATMRVTTAWSTPCLSAFAV